MLVNSCCRLSRVGILLGWIGWRNQADRVQWGVPSADFFIVEEGCMGAKIRHIAIATQDPDQIANFFKAGLRTETSWCRELRPRNRLFLDGWLHQSRHPQIQERLCSVY